MQISCFLLIGARFGASPFCLVLQTKPNMDVCWVNRAVKGNFDVWLWEKQSSPFVRLFDIPQTFFLPLMLLERLRTCNTDLHIFITLQTECRCWNIIFRPFIVKEMPSKCCIFGASASVSQKKSFLLPSQCARHSKLKKRQGSHYVCCHKVLHFGIKLGKNLSPFASSHGTTADPPWNLHNWYLCKFRIGRVLSWTNLKHRLRSLFPFAWKINYTGIKHYTNIPLCTLPSNTLRYGLSKEQIRCDRQRPDALCKRKIACIKFNPWRWNRSKVTYSPL